jgi:hypothetical protein
VNQVALADVAVPRCAAQELPRRPRRILGAAVMVIEAVLPPDAVDQEITASA